MKYRSLAAWLSVVALLGAGATFIRAQPPERPREGPARLDRAKLRAEIIKLRTEVEMLRFDYENARDVLLEELKIRRGIKMAEGMFGLGSAIQSSINDKGAKSPDVAPRQESEQDRKKAAEEAKKADEDEKREAVAEAAFIAERKKELARRFALLTEKRLDLEDAERDYREMSH